MLYFLNALFPVRYTAMGLSVMGLALSLFSWIAFGAGLGLFMLFAGLVCVGLYDLLQTKRSILRNYPVIGHLRFTLEFVRPEIRQYFIESDNEATPFSARNAPWSTNAPKTNPTSVPLAPSWMSMPRATSG